MRRRGFVLLLVALCGLGSGLGPARAEERGATLDAKGRVLRRSALQITAMKWAQHRIRFPSRCPVCQGTGALGGRVCRQCKGRKAWISPPDYRAAYYEMRTQAFRQLPGIQDLLETQYKAGNQGKPWPTRYKRYQVKEVELVDETHGIAWVHYDGSMFGTATYWVWSTDAKEKGEWCLHDNRSDGEWPIPGGAPQGEYGWEVLPSGELSALRSAAAGATRAFRAVEFLARGDCLRVSLEPHGAQKDVDAADLIAADALALFGPLFQAASPARARIETEWRTAWQNADGLERWRTTWTVSLDRATFEGRGWSSLAPAEQMGLSLWTPSQHPGWRRVVPKAALPAPPPLEPEPVPPTAPETPPAPAGGDEPAAPPPEPPAPAPVAPPPPPPAPPPSAPPRGPPPALTPKARKDGEAGKAKMLELYATAKGLYTEAMTAQQEGAHDLFQEKLEEVRTLLGEIEEVWQSKVVAAMPGRDDAEREELADENFGDVWNDIYALKGIVRKISSSK
jgi:hypothetical protein